MAAIVVQFLNSKKERTHRLKELREKRREWYRHALFDQGIKAAQEVLMWERRLRMAVHQVSEGRAKGDDVHDLVAGVTQLGTEARGWFEQNIAYLEYPKARLLSDFWGLLNSVQRWDGQSTDIEKNLNELLTFLHNWLLEFGGKYEDMRANER